MCFVYLSLGAVDTAGTVPDLPRDRWLPPGGIVGGRGGGTRPGIPVHTHRHIHT